MILVMVEVVLVLGSPTPHPKKLIPAQTGMMGCFDNLLVTSQHPLWCNIGLYIIHLVLLVVIQLLLVLVMVKVVWVRIPPTFPPIHLII